jgi:hypothetical protein
MNPTRLEALSAMRTVFSGSTFASKEGNLIFEWMRILNADAVLEACAPELDERARVLRVIRFDANGVHGAFCAT